jgi:hypothetical protein
MTRIGTLSLDTHPVHRSSTCSFKFGMTEIEVTVADASGQEKTCRLSFNV